MLDITDPQDCIMCNNTPLFVFLLDFYGVSYIYKLGWYICWYMYILRTRNFLFKLCRAHEKISRAHDFLSLAHDILSHEHDIISRVQDIFLHMYKAFHILVITWTHFLHVTPYKMLIDHLWIQKTLIYLLWKLIVKNMSLIMTRMIFANKIWKQC